MSGRKFKCWRCGEMGYWEYCEDPYQSDVCDIHTKHRICRLCQEGSAADI